MSEKLYTLSEALDLFIEADMFLDRLDSNDTLREKFSDITNVIPCSRYIDEYTPEERLMMLELFQRPDVRKLFNA